MRRFRLAVTASIALAVVVGIGVSRRRAEAEAAPSAPLASHQTGSARSRAPLLRGAPAREGLDSAVAPPAELPRSLQGTEVDGSLDAGPDGHLRVAPGILLLFDYFFSASGEEAEAVIVARITAHARAHLGEPALGEALALLDHYLAYRAAAGGLRPEATATIAERLQAIHELRRAHFGEAANALFGDDERAGAVAVEKSRVLQNPELSPEEKEDGLAAAEEGLSAADRRAREEVGAVLQRTADEATLRAAGADAAEIRQFRSGTLGVAAADRLEALDRERAAWKARVEAFRAERELRCAEQVNRTACETSLLAAGFDAHEQIRVRAILGMEAAAPE